MTPPSAIAHYKITGKLGEGGMGAVYRATDTKLNRDVAIKVLPDALANDPDYLARFTREAQVLAALNHPHIAAIYGIEERAIVMELVEGEEPRGPLAPADAIPIARQIAEALEAAHEKGIVHRDLKPANIKITPDGNVKVLDFGLAKAADPTSSSSTLTNSPTLTLHATQVGVIMGTAGYMAPEQAAGKPVDKRADIWSFGVVLYELLAGVRLFEGETIAHTLADVLRAEIDLRKLPAGTPPSLRELLARCLDRDPRTRLRDIGEARVILSRPPAPAGAEAVQDQKAPRSAWPLALVAGVLSLLAAILGFGWWRSAHPEPRPVVRLNVDLGQNVLSGLYGSVWLSPDGMKLAYLSSSGRDGRGLFLRHLDQPNATLVASSVDGAFFSPDSQWIGFISEGRLKKAPVHAGTPVVICDCANQFGIRGVAWGEDGTIVFGAGGEGLFAVSQDGGTPRSLIERGKGAASVLWPHFLPGGKDILFTANSAAGDREHSNISVFSRQTGQIRTVLQGGYAAQYLTSGHLAFIRENRVFAVRFDPDKLQVRGTPVPVIEDLAESYFNSETFDASRNGTLVFQSGSSVQSSWPIMWIDGTGKITPAVERAAAYRSPRVSPDGRRIAATAKSLKGYDLWVFDPERKSSTQLTFESKVNVYEAMWTPDGKYILYGTDEPSGLYMVRSDGSEGPRRVGDLVRPMSFSPDGRQLLCTGGGIFTVQFDLSDPKQPKIGTPQWILKGPGLHDAEFSPDGRWIAYAAVLMGREEIFVMPYRPSGEANGAKWRITSSGGKLPRWSRTARELFYRDHERRLMAVDYTIQGESFSAANPRLWCPVRVRHTGVTSNYDLAPDGKRILSFPVPEADGETGTSLHVTFLLNFFDELKRRLP